VTFTGQFRTVSPRYGTFFTSPSDSKNLEVVSTLFENLCISVLKGSIQLPLEADTDIRKLLIYTLFYTKLCLKTFYGSQLFVHRVLI